MTINNQYIILYHTYQSFFLISIQIPGRDNYVGKLTDDAFDEIAFSTNPKIKKDTPLRADRYHRWYKVAKKDQKGNVMLRHRGFSDTNVFMAMNTQPKIAGINITWCKSEKVCTEINQKWSYAIPLEIIYMTPLYKWNPYNIEYKGLIGTGNANSVHENRNGGTSPEKAFDGTNDRYYFQTPVEFFSGGEAGMKEDSSLGAKGVLDKQGINYNSELLIFETC